MVERRELLINGQPLPDGYFLNRWFESRFDANKNVLLLIIGATGSGKSWASLKICEDWYKHRFNDDKKFPIENVCFSLIEAAKRIRNGQVGKEEFVVVEEAGIQMNSLDFQSKTNKLFNNILQSARCKNTGFIFNLPSFALMNKTARTLAHGVFEMVTIRGNYSVLKPKGLQTNAMSGKIYPKYLRQKINGRVIAAKRLKVGIPSIDLINPYEINKQNYVNTQLDKMIDSETPKEQKKNDISTHPYLPLWEKIVPLLEKDWTHQQIADSLGVHRTFISKQCQNMNRNKYYTPKWLRKEVLETPDPLAPPLST